MFPIPRITESFIDGVVESLGWKRYEEIKTPIQGQLNADYVAPNCVLELKIFEEEGLEKVTRQSKISKLFGSVSEKTGTVDITYSNAPNEIMRDLENIVSGPIKTAVKKASQQIKTTKIDLDVNGDGILIAVNNGYTYLDYKNFEKLVVKRCLNDSSNIDFAICITVEYHQGDFDSYISCIVHTLSIRSKTKWRESDRFRAAVHDFFDKAMTVMMQNQLDPSLWKSNLEPISEIRFDKDGVSYIREAPYVPDSRFGHKEI